MAPRQRSGDEPHRNNVIGILAAPLVATALAPAAGMAQLGAAAPEHPVSGLSDRTATELGQAVGEPGDGGAVAANARASRTPTELARSKSRRRRSPRRCDERIRLGRRGDRRRAVPALGLAAFGGLVFIDRRRSTTSSRVPAVTT